MSAITTSGRDQQDDDLARELLGEPLDDHRHAADDVLGVADPERRVGDRVADQVDRLAALGLAQVGPQADQDLRRVGARARRSRSAASAAPGGAGSKTTELTKVGIVDARDAGLARSAIASWSELLLEARSAPRCRGGLRGGALICSAPSPWRARLAPRPRPRRAPGARAASRLLAEQLARPGSPTG